MAFLLSLFRGTAPLSMCPLVGSRYRSMSRSFGEIAASVCGVVGLDPANPWASLIKFTTGLVGDVAYLYYTPQCKGQSSGEQKKKRDPHISRRRSTTSDAFRRSFGEWCQQNSVIFHSESESPSVSPPCGREGRSPPMVL